jgi:hypothetical protein
MERSWRVNLAWMGALLQALGGVGTALVAIALLLSGTRADEGLLLLGAALFTAAVAIAYLVRVDMARLFMAGECALIAVASCCGFLGLLIERFGCFALLCILPAALGAVGASLYVSADVRTWCRR